MDVLEKVKLISETINKLFGFIHEEKSIEEDAKEYFAKPDSKKSQDALLMDYVFSHTFDGQKTLSNIYIEKNEKNISKEEKEILEGLSESFVSIFEIKKVLKDGFELYSLVNEKEYTVKPLVKMVNFRGISAGQFIEARIFPLRREYYLIEISELLSSLNKEFAYKRAVLMQINNPGMIYRDNEEKQKELEETLKRLDDKFVEFFGSEEIITSNKNIDELLGLFNDYVENDTEKDQTKLDSLIEVPESSEFFEIKELARGLDMAAIAAGGFSSHDKEYDAAIVYDKELGMYVLPFYKTFSKIAEEGMESVKNAEECVKYYIENIAIPPSVVNKFTKKYKNLENIIKEVYKGKSVEELLHTYKEDYYTKKQYSSTIILYTSKAFDEIMGYSGRKNKTSEMNKTGRNEACPCGSGKKYKKCCGK